MLRSAEAPAFGTATLANCERELIHLPGSIQPHGALIVVDAATLKITRASENLARFLCLDSDPLGLHMRQINAGLAKAVELIGSGDEEIGVKHVLHCPLGSPAQDINVSMHRVNASETILELEPAGDHVDLAPFIEQSFQTVLSALTLRELCDATARIFKQLAGYDRVMVYRFDEEGHGTVFSELCEANLEPYLGNRYPSTDIPQMARRLYERNRIRVLVDLEYEPVPLRPPMSQADGSELDMSLCGLRSVSPIHVQYLRNMGVTATLVVSLMVGGKLWGLISCHHYRPRNIGFEVRTACELLAETVATRIAALESFARAEAELAVRRIEQRIIETIAREGDWRCAISDNYQSLMQPLQATGVALVFEGQVLANGDVPSTQHIWALVKWLDSRDSRSLFATSSLTLDAPEFVDLKSMASGVISVPISRSGEEYLIWFRPERIRTVTWGGDPLKPVEVGDDPRDLSPRRSFAQWHQLVEGTSDAWTATDVAAARLIGESIEDVVYQFRAVRMLIAQDQLAQVSRDVRNAQQPVVVTDGSGRLLLVNDAFYRLLPEAHGTLMSIDDLPPVFRDSPQVKALLQVLLRDQQAWRGEVEIEAAPGEVRSLMLRADPVFAEVNRVLGFVLFFADITDRKKIEVARRRFQENIVATHLDRRPRLDSRSDLLYRNLLASAVSNAKLAALEISDVVELDLVPEMLDSVHDSVDRTRRLLTQLLVRYAEDQGK